MSWENVEIDSVIDFTNGFAFKSKFFTDNKSDIPLVKGENLGKGEVLWSESKYWRRDMTNNLEKFFLNPNDVILAMDRPYVGGGLKFAMIKQDSPTALQVQRIARLVAKEDKITPLFLKYVIGSLDFLNYIKNIQGGVGVPHISPSQIKKFKFNLPHLQTQKCIASILSAYDDLIENNLKRIKLLEETAHNFYKEWFVNFRFPNYEHTEFDAESSLPEGWATRKVTDFFDFIKGIEVGSANYENEPNSETLPFLRVGDISKRDGGIYVKKSLVKDKIVDKNDILISFDGSIGSVGYGLEGSYSSGLRKITSKTEIFGKGFMYCLVKSDNIQNTINSHAKGTTILHAGTSIIHLEFPLATDNVILSFNQISNPIFEQMVSLNNQNQKLKEARDILLPRLMNRTIEV